MNKKNENINLWLFIPIVVIILIGLCTYHAAFGHYGISGMTVDWSNFATYLNVFVSMCNLYLFAILTVKVYQYNRNRDIANDSFQRSIQQPILVLRSSQPDNDSEKWYLANIGNGAALNIRVAESNVRDIKWITPVTKCYSLGKDGTLPLSWLKYANVICVVYEDIFGERYVSIGADDESQFRRMKGTFVPIEIEGYALEKKDIEAFWSLPSERLHRAILGVSSTTTSHATTK